MTTLIDRFWYAKHPLRWFLWPLSLIYQGVVSFRQLFLHQHQFDVPIIVVGNLTVGGTGKTPLVIALAQAMKARGLRVGIVSRGYGSRVKQFPYEVSTDDNASFVGDEPLLLAKKTHCPVVIAPRRVEAVQYLLDHHQSQLIISDDGLQHYAMGRAIEIVVIDGIRGFGNGLCLPAGPLREGLGRLTRADFIVVNGSMKTPFKQSSCPASYRMNFIPGGLTQLVSGKTVALEALTMPVAAVAAIGYPQRFFSLLESMGVSFKPYPFTDHHQFQPKDICFLEKDVVMTEKDAVKCTPFATDSMYYLPVEAQLENQFWDALWQHDRLQK